MIIFGANAVIMKRLGPALTDRDEEQAEHDAATQRYDYETHRKGHETSREL